MRSVFRFVQTGIQKSITTSDNCLELTLALIKPDACSNPHAFQSIRDIILDNNLYVVKTRFLHLTQTESALFYSGHKDKFFYNRLVTFMASGPICAHILTGSDAISRWRTLMGPTKSYTAQYEAPDSIRGRFGLTDTRNATHGSDSTATALQEIQFFFPNFNVGHWYETEECYYRNCKVVLNSDTFEHEIARANSCEK